LSCSSSSGTPARKEEQNENRSASRRKSVEQQIKRTGGNVKGGARFGKSGKVAVKRSRRGADNPATGGNNPPGGAKRKSKMTSRKRLKAKANSVPELISETLGRIKV